MFSKYLANKRTRTILLVVALSLFMVVTLVLANYISNRTQQEDASAGTPGNQDCTNGLCGQLTTVCSANQTSGSVSYDLNFSAPLVNDSGARFTRVTYNLCLNPETNATEKAIYDKLGPGMWEGEVGTANHWSCYQVGAYAIPTATPTVKPTSGGGGGSDPTQPPSATATTAPSPTSTGGGGGTPSTPPQPTAASCSAIPSEGQCEEYSNCYWVPGTGGGGQCEMVQPPTTASPTPTNLPACSTIRNEDECKWHSSRCVWYGNPSNICRDIPPTSTPSPRPTDCIPSINNNYCDYQATATPKPSATPCVPSEFNLWCGNPPGVTFTPPTPTLACGGPGQPDCPQGGDFRTQSVTGNMVNDQVVLNGNTTILGKDSKATKFSEIVSLYNNTSLNMSRNQTMSLKVVAHGEKTNTDGTKTDVRNDQIYGQRKSFAPDSCAIPTNTPFRPGLDVTGHVVARGTKDTPNGTFARLTVQYVDKDSKKTILLERKTVTAEYQNYSFSGKVVVDDLSEGKFQVVFDNDAGDRNLYVKELVVNNKTFTSTAWNTYSTGAWSDGTCRVPGFFKTEGLLCDGFFEYESERPGSISPTPVPGTITLDKNVASNGDVALTWNNLDGNWTYNLLVCDTENCDPNTSKDSVVLNVSGVRKTDARPWSLSGVRSYQIEAYPSNGQTPKASNVVTVKAPETNYVIARGTKDAAGTSNAAMKVTQKTAAGNTELMPNTVVDLDNKRYYFSYSGGDQVAGMQVHFTNDSGTRDLYVDKLVINGIPYESEAVNTYSTGSYSANHGGCTPGYYKTEVLGCTGYFEYKSTAVAPELNLTADLLGNGNVKLEWWSVSGATTYNVRSCNGTNCNPVGSQGTELASVSNPEYLDTRAWGDIKDRRYSVIAVANGRALARSLITTVNNPSVTPPAITTVVPPVGDSLSCTKTYTFGNKGKIGSKVTYTIELDKQAPGPDGTVVIRDDFKDGFKITEKPDYCVVKTQPVRSSVLGISDFYSERGSVLISFVLFSALSGGVVYLIVLKNRKSIGWETFQEKPYLAGLLAAGIVLTIGSVYFLATQDDVAPTDTPALTQAPNQYLECAVPEEVKSFTYTMRIRGNGGEVANNVAEVFTGNNADTNTCSVQFVLPTGPADTEEPEPSDSATPTPTFAVSAPPFSPTPSDTPRPPRNSSTPTPSTGVEDTDTPTPSDTSAVTPPTGFICGAADIDGNGELDFIDFGAYQEGFASHYMRECADTEEMRQTYSPCGGKDVVISNDGDYEGRFGLIDIYDFQSFAQRYSSEINPRSCDLSLYPDL